MDISNLSDKELRALNKKVVERIRFLQQAKAHQTMLQFNIGERVTFEDNGDPVFGVLTRFNQKSVTVITDDHCKWNIHPSFLKKIEPKKDFKDVTPYKKVVVSINSKIENPPLTASRNSLCPCGSGKKFKRCCLQQNRAKL